MKADKPVLVFQFTASEGPGYLADFLARRHIDLEVIRIDLGHTLPFSLDEYSGLALMGGPMSVNDKLPWITPLLELVREAVLNQIPVLGHCLGGQLLAKALGAVVGDNALAEIGWIPAQRLNTAQAIEWLGPQQDLTLFQWHYQTFAIPEGAEHLLRSDYCENQAYVVDNLHIAFQCHIEMQAAMVRDWCAISPEELTSETSGAALLSQALPPQPAIQSAQVILADLEQKVHRLNQLAEHVYSRWCQGLKLKSAP